MPAQLTRFDFDQKALSWALRGGLLYSQKSVNSGNNCYFPSKTVLLDDSSVKKLTEIYDLTK